MGPHTAPRLAVTGATGFIGRHLVRRLAHKADLTIILRPSSRFDPAVLRAAPARAHDVFVYDGDIEHLIEALDRHRVDGVVHLATRFLTAHDRHQVRELIDTNVRFGAELLEAAHHANVRWFLNTGTFWQHYHSDDYAPVNLYAATKQCLDDIGRYYAAACGLRFITLMLNDTYGPDDHRPKLFNLLRTIALTGEALDMSPGDQRIDILHVDDVCRAFEILIDGLHCGAPSLLENGIDTFAVSAPHRPTLKELAGIFEAACNRRLNIRWGAKPARQREVLIPWAHGVTVPGWQQTVSLEDGIRNLFED